MTPVSLTHPIVAALFGCLVGAVLIVWYQFAENVYLRRKLTSLSDVCLAVMKERDGLWVQLHHDREANRNTADDILASAPKLQYQEELGAILDADPRSIQCPVCGRKWQFQQPCPCGVKKIGGALLDPLKGRH